MAMTMLVLAIGLVGLTAITAGGIALRHVFRLRERRITMEQIKDNVIPELEKMTLDMMDKTMDMMPDKMMDMTKKMLSAQKQWEEDYYKD